MRRCSLFSLAAALLATAAAPVAAQDGAAVDMTGMGIYAMEDTVMESAQDTVVLPRARGGGGALPLARQAAIPSMTYAPSIQRRKANLAQFVAKTKAKDPEGAAKMAKLFASTDVIAAMGRPLGALGLRTDNVADAYAAWWITAWNAVNGRTGNPSRAQVAAVKEQSARALASTGEFARASDAVKQEVAEANLVQAALIEAYVEQAGGNQGQLKKIAAAVRQGARGSGLNLDSMVLTEDGFVPR